MRRIKQYINWFFLRTILILTLVFYPVLFLAMCFLQPLKNYFIEVWDNITSNVPAAFMKDYVRLWKKAPTIKKIRQEAE